MSAVLPDSQVPIQNKLIQLGGGLRNTKNASNAKDHIKLKHADHPREILSEQRATEKSMKNVETAETDTQAVLDLTRGPEQKETAATTSDEAGVVTTGSALERFFRASEKTLTFSIKFLDLAGITVHTMLVCRLPGRHCALLETLRSKYWVAIDMII
ncbi:hypothetical protein GQ600_12386 [Phytophthora cactorum]|nr:hypothetical protein GQ600_12386 [Phytophthora cactorum]